jgi:hypothetical protein
MAQASFHAVPNGPSYSIRKTRAGRALKVGLDWWDAWKEVGRLAKEHKTHGYWHARDGRIAARVDYTE